MHEDAHIKISRDSHRVENYELTVNLVKAEDSGEYEVRAKNENGTAVTKTTVIVQSKWQPFFILFFLFSLKSKIYCSYKKLFSIFKVCLMINH